MGDAIHFDDSLPRFHVLLSPVMNLVFKPAEQHRFVHLLAGVNPFDDQMAEGVRNVGETPPGMAPLKPSSEIEGVLCLLKDVEEDKD
jgi:hypothetical protein